MADLDPNEYTLWRYLLSIESMLAHTRQYCEIAPANYNVYSDEYVKILILSSIHFEHCSKILVGKWRPGADTSNMGKIRVILMEQRQGIANLAIGVFGTKIELSPLSEWSRGEKAEWWEDYTVVKHNYVNGKLRGNQINALNATAACLICLLYYFESNRPSLYPSCSMLTYEQPRFLYDANDITPLP